MLNRDEDPLRKRYQYDIDSDIPLESPTRYKYPFHLMNVGDSFFIPFNKRDENSVRGGVSSSAYKMGYKVSVRKRTEKHNGKFIDGVRVWYLGER